MAEQPRLKERPARSIRFRLLAIALLPTLVILPLLLGIAIVRWNAKFDALLITKVNGDLTIAHQYLSRILENTGEHIQALAVSAAFRDTVGGGDAAGLPNFLEDSRRTLGLDFLMLVDEEGRPLHAQGPAQGRVAGRGRSTEWHILDRHRYFLQRAASRTLARLGRARPHRAGRNPERRADRPQERKRAA